jgi:uncharacterized protein
MSRVVHFEIHAEDPDRAVQFYTALFNWQIQKWDGPAEYWLIRTGSPEERGIDGGLMRRRGPSPVDGQAVNAYPCTTVVTDLDAMVKRAVGLGGVIVVPKMPIPGLAWLAYAKDTEGNIFGMMQNDPGAK